MPLFPFRFQEIGRSVLVVADAGDFVFTTPHVLERLVLQPEEASADPVLIERGLAYQALGDFYWNSFVRRFRRRKIAPSGLRYVIAIPTLRCDLSCGYCQVARAPLTASSVDWDDGTEQAFRSFLLEHCPRDNDDGLPLTIEFQGGEASLRLDVIERTADFCDRHFPDARIIICTNLSHVSNSLLRLLNRDRVSISTSLDGPETIHRRNRTESGEVTDAFFRNMQSLIETFGVEKISALPTVRVEDYGRLREIIDVYRSFGLKSVYLRPVSPHGFARSARDWQAAPEQWFQAYREAVRYLFQLNVQGQGPVREFGLEVALHRIFRPGANGHVDLRSPNPAARDAIVVDHDGNLYPSDESRMLARLRIADCRVGSVFTGIDPAARNTLTWNQMGEFNEDCLHCAYQPFCGVDVIDDLARYGRIDLPRAHTAFCQTQTNLFSFIFEMLEKEDPEDLFNLVGHLTGEFSYTPLSGPYRYDPA